MWYSLLRLRGDQAWPVLWRRIVAGPGEAPLEGRSALPDRVYAGPGRPGSNALVIGSSHSGSGAPVLAGDTHLGISIPNNWLLAGIRSPGYHAVGLMAPGMPVVAVGRSAWIAWGGTSLRAASSDLYDLSGLPPGTLGVREETIRVRCWPDRTVRIREAPWGRVVSEPPQLEGLDMPPAARRWMGHEPSDEISALLLAARARGFAQFRTAFEGFSVPAQTMVYADAAGSIGSLMAARLPARSGPPPGPIVDPQGAEPAWQSILDAGDLPVTVDPEQGFIVSANDRPAEAPVPTGFFFSPDDRAERMSALLREGPTSDADPIRRLHQDVYSASSLARRDLLLGRLDRIGPARPATERERRADPAMGRPLPPRIPGSARLRRPSDALPAPFAVRWPVPHCQDGPAGVHNPR